MVKHVCWHANLVLICDMNLDSLYFCYSSVHSVGFRALTDRQVCSFGH